MCLFVLRLNIPVNNFQSCWDGATASCVLPILSGSKVSCSRTQQGGVRFRNPDLSLRSPMLYHCITAHPEIVYIVRCLSPLILAVLHLHRFRQRICVLIVEIRIHGNGCCFFVGIDTITIYQATLDSDENANIH